MKRPSELDRSHFIDSTFQRGEKEAWAIFFLKMCHQNGDTFDQEFEWSDIVDFLEGLDKQETVHPAYKGMVKMFAEGVMQALAELIDDEFVERRDGEKNIQMFVRVTPKFLEFYESYGAQPA